MFFIQKQTKTITQFQFQNAQGFLLPNGSYHRDESKVQKYKFQQGYSISVLAQLCITQSIYRPLLRMEDQGTSKQMILLETRDFKIFIMFFITMFLKSVLK